MSTWAAWWRDPVAQGGVASQAWRFFRIRVDVEEQQLRGFFGPAYVSYAQHVPSGLPFIP